MSESESSAPLDINGAANVFASMLEPQAEEAKEPEQEQPTPEAEEPTEAESEQPEEAEQEEDDPLVTIKVDGKELEVPLSELKNGYQRQADYTRKTMEVSEQRKAAESERQAAQQERQQYAQRLQEQQIILQSALADQNQINWQQLIDNDPIEYLKQKNLFEQRQSALQRTQWEQQQLMQQQQAEEAKAREAFLSEQQEQLLAKLPDWKDPEKAKLGKSELRNYLKSEFGFDDDHISNVVDHRAILMARKAMLYDAMVSKAKAAEKKVATLPQKVERPGVSESKTLDKRSSAFQRLNKSGSIDDAARVFASFL